MSSELPKYIKVPNLQTANEKSDLYSLREAIVYTHTPDNSPGHIMTDVEYLMSLREESKYDNIEKYKKVDISYEEQSIPDGWIVIHHTSKELILIKRGNVVTPE